MTQPWETLDRVDTKDGPLELKRRGTRDFLITLRGRIVMTSAAHRSEDELARLACAKVADRPKPRVLVSGLGMGFTLRAALDALPRGARVAVAELNPVVARWCQGPLGALTDGAVNDRRVRLSVGDVTALIAEAAEGSLDAVLLDMYEGPAPARIKPWDPLYGREALTRARRALVEDGVLAVWSEKPSAAFDRELVAAGFTTERHKGGHGASVHFIYLGVPATRRGRRPHDAGSSGQLRLANAGPGRRG